MVFIHIASSLRSLNCSQLNGKHRKHHIFQLKRDDGSVVNDAGFKHNITNYYNGFFGSSEHNNIMMSKAFGEDIPQLFVAENKFLVLLA